MDLNIKMSANGGDVILIGNDLETTESLFNQPILAWFGGNVEANTTGDELPEEQRFDWWGNALLFPQNLAAQFNSNLERALLNTALTSAGRLSLERIAKDDLSFFRNFADISTTVFIPRVDTVEINVQLQEPANIEDKTLRVIWDATRQEVIEQEIL